MYSRLAAMPDAARPLYRAQLMAALSVGTDIIRLRRFGRQLGIDRQLDSALALFAQGNSAAADMRLAALDHRLSSVADADPSNLVCLRARSHIVALRETLEEHRVFFDKGALL